jgi:hypothetical protein
MSLPKPHNWREQHFHNFILENAHKPFVWGENDCCLFPANAIQAISGVDLADDFRGRYRDEASAFALIKSLTGGSSVADAAAYCAHKHGLVEHEFPLMAKRGDLVVVKNGDALICGLVHLNGRHVITVSTNGHVRLPVSNVVRAWSI